MRRIPRFFPFSRAPREARPGSAPGCASARVLARVWRAVLGASCPAARGVPAAGVEPDDGLYETQVS